MHACLIISLTLICSGADLQLAGFNMPDTVLYLFIVTTLSVLGIYLLFKVDLNAMII